MSRTFRLFISSTFSDMAHERRILHEQVFPKLTRLCASRGAGFQAVDLRWGVNEESQLDHKTMDICLGEIERCQRLSPKPNFLVLLGDRYGWEPVPARILSDEFEELRAQANRDEGELLHRWYVRDDNAVPPQHVLVPRDEAHADVATWRTVEALLRVTLRHLADAVNLQGEVRDKYFQSATHQEIARGALSLPTVVDNTIDPAEHVLACFRTIEGLPQEPNSFFDDRSEQLKALKEQLRARLSETDESTDNVYTYAATWQPTDRDDIALTDENAFAERVLDHFTRVITAQLDGLEEGTPLEAEQQAHRTFRDDRCRHFAGREETLSAIDEYLDSDENRVMAIIGPGGSGKSALMAQVTQRVEPRPGLLVYRFIGATPASTRLDNLLGSIDEELVQKLGDSIPRTLLDQFKNRDFMKMYRWRSLLRYATAERPITVVLDGLDQLTEAEARELSWLPNGGFQDAEGLRMALPAHAKFVVSLLPQLRSSLPESFLDHPGTGAWSVELPPLSGEAGRTILQGWLDEVGRTLQPTQQTAVLEKFKTNGLPLYLKLAFGQARHWAHGEEPQLADGVDGIVESTLDALERTHTPSKGEGKAAAPLVQTVLGMLQASRYGLSETELLDMLCQDADFFETYKQTLHHPLAEDRLPMAVWSRLYLDLAPYLVERNAQGGLLLGFFHRQVGEVIGRRYGAGESHHRYHAQLAAYFGEQKNFLDDRRQQPNGRRLGELPYQQLQAEQWKELTATLVDFDLLMATCQAGLQEQLIQDYRNGWNALQAAGHQSIRPWAALFLERGHILRQGNEDWPANHLLLQLAMEHAHDSPVTLAAETNLAEGTCDWLWLKRAGRVALSGCVRVLEGHRGGVTGATVLPNGRLLSWSKDGTLRLWNLDTGDALATLKGHTGGVVGTTVLPKGRLLSWSDDKTLRTWNLDTGDALATLKGHTGGVAGATVLPNGRLLSWSDDKTLRIWNPETGESLKTLEGHTDRVLRGSWSDDRLLSWSHDNTLRIWDPDTGGVLDTIEGDWERFLRATALPDGPNASDVESKRTLSWFVPGKPGLADKTLRIWDPFTSEVHAILKGHTGRVNGAIALADGRPLSWSDDKSLRTWDTDTGEVLATLEGHERGVTGASALPDGRVLSWSKDGTLRIWNLDTGEALASFEGHTDGVTGASALPNGHVLSWSDDNSLRIWNPDAAGALLTPSTGHSVSRTILLQDDQLVSWSTRENRLRLWNLDTGENSAMLEGHTGGVWGAMVMPDGRLVSWSEDLTLRVWDPGLGVVLATLEGHTMLGWNSGAIALLDGRLLSWSSDELLLWDLDTGEALASFRGRKSRGHPPPSGATTLPDGRLLTWGLDTLQLLSSDTGESLATLKGHRWIIGATALPDGRLLSWSSNELQLWDPDNGEALGCWAMNTVAQEVPDLGRAMNEGKERIVPAFINDELKGMPSLTHNLTHSVLAGNQTGWGLQTRLVTLNFETARPDHVTVAGGPNNRVSHRIAWGGDGQWRPSHLTASGTVVARDGNRLAFLNLHHGNRRVTIEEAIDILGIPSGEPE